MTTTLIKIAVIVTDAGTQVRAAICEQTVSQYAAEMLEGAKFPPIDVFHDGNQFILADGFHRVMSCTRNDFKDIEARIHKGTKSDALRFALKANSTHGLKRSNADKRRSVEMALTEWPSLSDSELSNICAVNRQTVTNIRAEVQPANLACCPRIGADGKTRKIPAPKSKTITPEKAAALMSNVTPANQEPVSSAPSRAETHQSGGEANPPCAEPANTAPAAPSAYSLSQFKVDLTALVDLAIETLSDAHLGHARLDLDIQARRVRDHLSSKKNTH